MTLDIRGYVIIILQTGNPPLIGGTHPKQGNKFSGSPRTPTSSFNDRCSLSLSEVICGLDDYRTGSWRLGDSDTRYLKMMNI